MKMYHSFSLVDDRKQWAKLWELEGVGDIAIACFQQRRNDIKTKIKTATGVAPLYWWAEKFGGVVLHIWFGRGLGELGEKQDQERCKRNKNQPSSIDFYPTWVFSLCYNPMFHLTRWNLNSPELEMALQLLISTCPALMFYFLYHV